MNVGSLFSGIGGLDLGLERAGHRVVFQCEADPWRRTVLAERFPGVPCYEDVAVVGRLESDSEHPTQFADKFMETAVGLLCGGFPCQDVSVAGRRRGLAGERSGLFYEFARIAGSLRPRWVLLENVPGLLTSHAGRDFAAVLGALVELGYGVAWRILDSRFFGVPQRRRRVFILGALTDGDPRAAAGRAAEVLAVGSRCRRHPATGRAAGADVAGTLGNRTSGGGRTDDLDGHGAYVSHSLRASGADGSEDGTGRGTPLVSHALNGKRGNRDDRESETFVPSAFNWQSGGDVRIGYSQQADALSKCQTQAVHGAGVRRLTPRECERLQAFPDDWTAIGPDSRRYAALGDAVTVAVAEWIGRRLP